MAIVIIEKSFKFDAAHSLPEVKSGHKCGRNHGHTFKVTVKLKGEIDKKKGWVMDFGDLSAIVKPIIDNELDHRNLNDIEGLENPTSENICVWLWYKLQPSLPTLYSVVVKETENSMSEFFGEN